MPWRWSWWGECADMGQPACFHVQLTRCMIDAESNAVAAIFETPLWLECGHTWYV